MTQTDTQVKEKNKIKAQTETQTESRAEAQENEYVWKNGHPTEEEVLCQSSCMGFFRLFNNSKKTIEETEESTSAIETGESSNSGSVPLPISDLDPGPQK